MTAMEELTKLSHLLPLEILNDINRRCGDWLSSGGKEDDAYIHQQVRFAKRFIDSQHDVVI